MDTLRKFKLKINLKKVECLNNNNFWDAAFFKINTKRIRKY